MTARVDDRGWRGVVPNDADAPRTLFDAPVEAELLDEDTIEARFQRHHAQHPAVYEKLREYAFELLAAGYDHFGISLIWERARYESMVGARPGESPWRLDNSLRSRYSRLLRDQEPELRDALSVRELRTA